ncbi:hypothetical protein N9L71_04580 [Verrucomicrobiales bacterium]|nr:hypothetical protein [Verrucomicrobiales bacterium]
MLTRLFFSLTFFLAEMVIAGEQKPNFVFILADDCSYLDLELYGGPAKTQ